MTHKEHILIPYDQLKITGKCISAILVHEQMGSVGVKLTQVGDCVNFILIRCNSRSFSRKGYRIEASRAEVMQKPMGLMITSFNYATAPEEEFKESARCLTGCWRH
jgi:hypothetical protein